MKVVYDPLFIRKLKKANVRIRKSVKDKLLVFSKSPNNSQLNNHQLKDEYRGCRSINITNDWRAIYEEVQISKEKVAYFIALGTHKELYKN